MSKHISDEDQRILCFNSPGKTLIKSDPGYGKSVVQKLVAYGKGKKRQPKTYDYFSPKSKGGLTTRKNFQEQLTKLFLRKLEDMCSIRPDIEQSKLLEEEEVLEVLGSCTFFLDPEKPLWRLKSPKSNREAIVNCMKFKYAEKQRRCLDLMTGSCS